MKVEVLFFGVLTELMQHKRITLEDCSTTDVLLGKLHEMNGNLKTKSFKIAVNNKLVTDSILLNNGDEIALMPPFAGG